MTKSSGIKNLTVFLDGRMVEAENDLVNALAPGIVQGQGVFETMRIINGRIFALERHLDRLFRGLCLLKINSPYTRKQWGEYLYQTIEVNALKEARIRMAVWLENKNLRIAIVCQEITEGWDDKHKKGIKAIISTVKRKKTRYSNIKSMDYQCFRKAYDEAGSHECDESFLLNHKKEVVEGSRTNIFYIKDNELFSPMVKCGCLNGITRQIIIETARRLGMTFKASVVDVRQLLQADEVFVTNSIIGVAPLVVLNGKSIGNGEVGAITKRMRDEYNTNVYSSCRVE